MPKSTAIPSEARRPLEFLARLSDEVRSNLLSTLKEMPLLSPLDAIHRTVGEAVGKAESDDQTSAVAQTLVAIAAQVDDRLSLAELSEAIAKSNSLELSEEERERLASFLPEVLSLPVLTTSGKAVGLMAEFAHGMTNARIVSDIRPIFATDPDQRPEAAAITHTLLLDYLDSGDLRRFTVTLTRGDLLKLKRESERALAKTSTLRGIFGDAGLAHFEFDEGDAEDEAR